MASENLEDRIAVLEEEVVKLKRKLEKDKGPWWRNWASAFLNDPYFEKAAKLGRQYRESLRPNRKKPETKRKATHGGA
jgi:hypothetical protein